MINLSRVRTGISGEAMEWDICPGEDLDGCPVKLVARRLYPDIELGDTIQLGAYKSICIAVDEDTLAFKVEESPDGILSMTLGTPY